MFISPCVRRQVEGKAGLTHLKTKISNNGVRVLYNGSLAASGATMVGHFPWFYTFNQLNASVRGWGGRGYIL